MEEIFLVKYKSKHSCESVIFFDVPKNIIEPNCRFKYDFNTAVTLNILDGGSQVILANIVNKKRFICSKIFNFEKPLPNHEYAMVNRSILCNCEIECGLTYVLCSIGSCSESQTQHSCTFPLTWLSSIFLSYAWNSSSLVRLATYPALLEIKSSISLS